MKKIGFVIPWFYREIPGGAEMELRGTVRHLYEAGMEVEILTTCVKEFNADWTKDYFQPGTEDYDGILIRRFPVRAGNMKAFHQVNAKLMENRLISTAEEQTFLGEMVNSPQLYRYIREHKQEYQAFAFIPYMFGTTYYGMQECLEKAVLIPCLHDESYARLQSFRLLFPHIAGMVFHARPEMQLAESLYDLKKVHAVELGEGVETDYTSDAARFRNKYDMKEPYLLYAGRKDSAKNINTLITYFREYRKRQPDSRMKLVLIGGGTVAVPEDIQTEVLDLGFLPAQDKYDACAGALALCQPSLHESFSIVIMESWLCGRPVLVHQDCNVTSYFAEESQGGLMFQNYFEFEGCLQYYCTHEEEAAQMGANGRAFVLSHFKWDIIVERYRKFFEEIGG